MLTFLGFYPSSPAKAEILTTYGANDFYFELEAGTTFTVRSTAQQYNIDSMLWLYNSNNSMLAANDDYYGLDSFISYNVQETGTYRLRTGVCCGDPARWYGTSYTIETNSAPSEVPLTSTSSTTTTTEVATTTTTEPPTTTTSSTTTTTTTTTTTSTTTTTIYVAPPTSVQSTTTTVPLTTTTSSTSTTTTSTTAAPVVTMAPVTTTAPTLPETTTTLEIPSTTTIAPQEDPEQVVDAEVLALLNVIANLPQDEIQAAVDNIIEEGVSAAEATALATNPEVLQEVSADQAAEIFDAVEVSDLSDAQAEQLVEAVQSASEEVRAEFEDKINVFGGKFNKYVPIGSTINVGQRKVLIAATGVLFMAPTVSVSSSTSSSSSSNSRRK